MPGEGQPDLRGPAQLYDERGRPVNPETKRINKDVIRSHNEVMLVIGVAEPEDGISKSQVESGFTKHHNYEDAIGYNLDVVWKVVELVGIWGVNGIRQRILVCQVPS
jgi:hypothetical protein